MSTRPDFRRISRRRLIGAGAIAGLFAATSFPAGAAPRRGGSLRIAVPGAFREFDPTVRFDDAMHLAAVGCAFDCLTEIAADGSVTGELAEGWDASHDARTWTFRLRRDALFHDGKPLLADDVVETLRRHVGREASSEASALLGAIESVKRASDHSVRIVLSEPDPGLPLLLSDPQLVILSARSEAGMGTGLYRISETSPDRLVFRRVPRHYKDGRAGWFDRVELLALETPRQRGEALASGRVDAALDPEASVLKALESRGRVRRAAGCETVVTEGSRLRHYPRPVASWDAALRAGRPGFPEASTIGFHHSARLVAPVDRGTLYPLDDFRIAERWWWA